MSSGRTGPYFLMSKSMQKPPKAFPLWILPSLGPCNGGSCRYAPERTVLTVALAIVEFWQGISYPR